ncbi:MAG: YecA family protein [Alkaliphilus sp.]
MRMQDKLINLAPEEGINLDVATIVKFDNLPAWIAVLDEYCTNPDCDCRDTTLSFFEIVDNEINDALFKIQINVDTWEMITQQVFRKDIDYEGMIEEFFRDIDDKTKLIIKKRFESGKTFNDEKLRGDIDYFALQEGHCMSYTEIFDSKDAARFIFKYKGIKYIVIDHYCTNPGCKCNDVILAFHELDTQMNFHSSRFALRVKFKKGKHKVEERADDIEDKEVEEIYKCFLKNLNDPDFGLLKERYAKMKKISITLEQNSQEVSNRQKMISKKLNSINVGRNAPCPCGSGKKYKKCCLS